MSKAFLSFLSRESHFLFFLNYHLHFHRMNKYILKSQFHVDISWIYQESIFVLIKSIYLVI